MLLLGRPRDAPRVMGIGRTGAVAFSKCVASLIDTADEAHGHTSRRMEDWRLAISDWRLAIGDWLAADG
jgi:hypothetical protein